MQGITYKIERERGDLIATLPSNTVSERRIARVFEQIDKNKKIKVKPDLIFVTNGGEPHMDYTFFHVTGIPKGLFEGSALIAKRNGDIAIFTSPLEEDIAKKYGEGIEIYTNFRNVKEDLRKVAGPSPKAIGINGSDLLVSSYKMARSAFKGTKLVDVEEALVSSRAIKDEDEIAAIKKACDIASKAYREIPQLLKDGVSESEIAAELSYAMQKMGGSGTSFESIVSFGRNSALPHYTAGQARLRKGQFVLLDYGTKYERYCSDITRTLVHGIASKEQKRMYEIVKEANRVGIESCTPDNTGAQAHLNAEKVINSTEYKGRFIHSLGHSLGLAVHDHGPGLYTKTKTNLEPGMVLTVEPGIYVPSIGGVRIEDDVLITKDKPRVLTSATRDLIEA